MDSEDSRPGSSASNSSSNQSDNSRPSTPTLSNQERKSPLLDSVASPASSVVNNNGRRSRQRSSSSQETARSQRSPSKSDSDTSSSSSASSDNEDDDARSAVSNSKTKSKASSGRSSSTESADKQVQSHSPSPVKSRRSSRNSSASSNNSQNFSRRSSREVNAENGAINITHEDLSDVSDMESEKRGLSLNNSKHSIDEEVTNAFSSAAQPTDPHELEQKRHYSVDGNTSDSIITDLRQKLDQKKQQIKAFETVEKSQINETTDGDANSGEVLDDLVETHDEDALDFEAEEGECQELSSKTDEVEKENKNGDQNKKSQNSDGEAEEGEELEEGEVSDEDEKRPEETEPKPVCRFYTRGQCTWGMSCRFLHPGVTDKGNYTMFDLVRAVPVSGSVAAGGRAAANFAAHSSDYHDFRNERPPLHHRAPLHHHQVPSSIYSPHTDPRAALSSAVLPEGPVVVESAWERGLRTAKEMMRKANKRKEQDMDFEDKKMNLTLSPDELEKDPYYLKERASPPEPIAPFGRHNHYQEPSAGMYSSPDRFGRAPPVSVYDEVDPYGRSTRYRELPPHRMPQYEDERRVRPTREVIVQRVEPVGRGDEWNDPWMRSKSPGARGSPRDRRDKRRRDRRSYSSNSSYSSSSSSDSETSSDSSGSRSPSEHRRRYNSSTHKSFPDRKHGRPLRSPSVAQKLSKHSPSSRRSPTFKRRGRSTVSPVIEKRTAYSPAHKRKKPSPMPKKLANDKSKIKHRQTSSSSATGSSDSDASESESDSGSSSSESSTRSREQRVPLKRSRPLEKVARERKILKKDPPKKRSPISIEIKRATTVGASALASPTNSVSSEKDTKKTRREELLKQLRAVEDAIAKKRSKLN